MSLQTVTTTQTAWTLVHDASAGAADVVLQCAAALPVRWRLGSSAPLAAVTISPVPAGAVYTPPG